MNIAENYDEYAIASGYYDHVVPYRERQDVAFWVEMAQLAGGPVLELGCGTGRVLIPTAEVGVEIVGLDLSPSMLSICREKLAREPEPVRNKVQLVQLDMRRFDLGREFALVTIPFRAFQHLLTVNDQLACLTSIRRHLMEGGRLVVDVFNPSIRRMAEELDMVEHGEEPEFTMPDGRRVLRRNRTVSRDFLTQVQDVELIYYVTHSDGRRERLVHRFAMRYFFRFELEHLLARCGFQTEAVFSDYDKTSYALTAPSRPSELVFAARKAAG